MHAHTQMHFITQNCERKIIKLRNGWHRHRRWKRGRDGDKRAIRNGEAFFSTKKRWILCAITFLTFFVLSFYFISSSNILFSWTKHSISSSVQNSEMQDSIIIKNTNFIHFEQSAGAKYLHLWRSGGAHLNHSH